MNALWLSLIAECVAEGVEAGQFNPDGTPHDAAVELHALLDRLGIRLAVAHPPEVAGGRRSRCSRGPRGGCSSGRDIAILS